jgi:hypothetical protein
MAPPYDKGRLRIPGQSCSSAGADRIIVKVSLDCAAKHGG